MVMDFGKFEQRIPSAQCALDIFENHWASNVGQVVPNVTSGQSDVFNDHRVQFAVDYLGMGDGTLSGMSVLELGPLEGAHTYQLEKAGARVLAIEANVEAYLKCLIVKELTNMKNVKFELGDFNLFLDQNTTFFDMIFASGVLYHMPDPLRTLASISRRTNRCFIWTHYFDPSFYPGPERTMRNARHGDANAVYWELEYPDMGYGKFWGGNKPVAAWMTKADIVAALKVYGFTNVEVILDQPTHMNGACMSLIAKR
jgi:SAM-dependent methyltransferase